MTRPTRPPRPLLAALAALVVPVLSVLLALLAAPAGAAARSFPDATGDVRQGVDLEKVTVVYGQKWLKIRTHHRNLVRLPKYSAGLSVFLDTDRTDPGPELRFGGGLMDGTDYALTTADRFAPSSDVDFVRCDYRMRLDFGRDVAKIRLAPACVDEVDEIRVSVKAAAEQSPMRAYDWLGDKRSWWSVPRG